MKLHVFQTVLKENLNVLSAEYTLRDDGKITVVNKGNYISDPAKSNSAERSRMDSR